MKLVELCNSIKAEKGATVYITHGGLMDVVTIENLFKDVVGYHDLLSSTVVYWRCSIDGQGNVSVDACVM